MSMNPNNNGTYVGRLVRTPELRKTAKGKSVCSFTLAVDRNHPDGAGNWSTDFIDFVAWTIKAEKICESWKQGDLVCITGPLQIRRYKNKGDLYVSRAEILVDGRRKLTTALRNTVPPIPENYDFPPLPTDDDFNELEDMEELPL